MTAKSCPVKSELCILVVAPSGDYASYCGMWYDPATAYALVEPVATDPDYRKLGLGKAAVLEGIRRCGALGATQAYVGSSQQFYYQIGFKHWSSVDALYLALPHTAPGACCPVVWAVKISKKRKYGHYTW